MQRICLCIASFLFMMPYVFGRRNKMQLFYFDTGGVSPFCQKDKEDVFQIAANIKARTWLGHYEKWI